ncbi:hypothetical protein Poli38472_014593 [Pythium oligandrum]|uniref:Uncharacterized protein n=1 Tax=Pythium oligandrum TaxID=41045 RepID=A0A8K1FP72_PYTOL|nr:hypothetical protein Poli38472_014593 [Pythium oligandrum]|eukprot:TMW66617.1 hypothetical protein Poli38472_014593 [Pythium oligandrum]
MRKPCGKTCHHGAKSGSTASIIFHGEINDIDDKHTRDLCFSVLIVLKREHERAQSEQQRAQSEQQRAERAEASLDRANADLAAERRRADQAITRVYEANTRARDADTRAHEANTRAEVLNAELAAAKTRAREESARGARLETTLAEIKDELRGVHTYAQKTHRTLAEAVDKSSQLFNALNRSHPQSIVNPDSDKLLPGIALVDVSACPKQRRIYGNTWPRVYKLVERHVKTAIKELEDDGGVVVRQWKYYANGIPHRISEATYDRVVLICERTGATIP